MLDILTNHLSRYFVHDTADQIAIIPQFHIPQLLLHLRKPLKNHPGRNTFQPLRDFSGTIVRGDGREIYAHDRPRLLGYRFQNYTGWQSPEISPSSGSQLTRPEPSNDIGAPTPQIFEIISSASGSLETHAWENTKLSPLQGLSLFLPPASLRVSKSRFS